MKVSQLLLERNSNQLALSYGVLDPENKLTMVFDFKHTKHSYRRAGQRGISNYMIAYVLQNGECYYKQGLIYYVLGDKLRGSMKTFESLSNIVVLVSGDSNQIITCYRSNNPFKSIKVKSKKLSKVNAAA